MEYPKELIELVHYATDKNYKLVKIVPKSYVAILHHKSEPSKINIYWRKNFDSNKLFTIQTTLEHPKSGINQLNRKDVSLSLAKKIIENPRVHTNVGYRTKR